MKLLLTLTLVSLAIGHQAGAAILAATDFDGHSTYGSDGFGPSDTAGDLNWETNGIADPGDLTVVPDELLPNGVNAFLASGLFTNGDNADRFSPDLNIHNEASWYVDVPINVLGNPLRIDSLDLEVWTLNNGGNPQNVGREVDYSVSLFRSNGVLSAQSVEQDLFVHNATDITQPIAASFPLGAELDANSSYYIRIGVSADANRVGNNSGFDNLSINGAVIPEPSVGLLAALGLAAGLFRRARRSLL